MVVADKTTSRKIVLPDDSNQLDNIGIKVPSADLKNVTDDVATISKNKEVKYGIKSTTHKEQILKLSEEMERRQKLLNDPFLNTKEFAQLMALRRRQAEEAAVLGRLQWEAKREEENRIRLLKMEQRAKELLEKTESATHKRVRLEDEEKKKAQRVSMIDALKYEQNQLEESVQVFFHSELAPKYKHESSIDLAESPLSRMISSRAISSDRYGRGMVAYRCDICRYLFPEVLSLSEIHKHAHSQPEKHMEILLSSIRDEFAGKIRAKLSDFKRQDTNQEYRRDKIDESIRAFKKLKTRTADAVPTSYTEADDDRRKLREGHMSIGQFNRKWGPGSNMSKKSEEE
jgi:hypothetical protein